MMKEERIERRMKKRKCSEKKKECAIWVKSWWGPMGRSEIIIKCEKYCLNKRECRIDKLM